MASRQNHPSGHRGARPAGQPGGGLKLCLLGLVLALACGYRFSAGRGRLPDGGLELVIPQAENRTVEVSAGTCFTSALRREAERAGLQVGEGANAPRLVARVLSIVSVPRGVAVSAGRFRTREQEVVVKVELSLDLSPGKNLRFQLDERESYLSAPDLRGTEANRQLALQRTFKRLARQGMDRLSKNF